ncbi:acyltransferase family protein [Nocardioides rubriscoriae]|uniref:acyltransferase family protein n=1 Tax=Nocardioides rubriscoriae TaxID=642762 RepID=UPI0011DF7EFD|nr:acyltransferase family protein [Nocardioides rubriscoriae]
MGERRVTERRSDIQGLRAVAVLTVIAAHYGLPGAQGGFLGVDVFLVISGFLITQLLLAEVGRSGRLSLRDFYARRARRILPAATLVLVATVAFSTVVLGAAAALETVRDAAWATVFAANVRFSSVGTDYFARDQVTSPLQHYWSLSVEEQFYVVWPLLVIVCLLVLGRRRGGRRATWPLLVVLAAGVGVLFAYAVRLSHTEPVAAYFSAPARAWELGVGALVALVGARVSAPLGARARALLTTTGLVGITLAVTTFDKSTQSRAEFVAVPVLAAAMVLLAGIRHGDDVAPPTWPQRLLGVAPLRAIGDWSFSLYLWHWPLLVILEARYGTVSPLARVDLVLLSLALAALTYRWVEQPLRNPVRVTRRRALSLYPASVGLLAAACAVSSVVVHQEASTYGEGPAITVQGSQVTDAPHAVLSPDPVVALVQASVYAGERGRPVPRVLRPGRLDLADSIAGVGACDYSPADARQVCPRGDVDADRSIVVIGDSHARMWISAFERIAAREGYRTYYFVKPLCTAADVVVSDLTGAPWGDCSAFRHWAFDQVDALRPALTVVASTAPEGAVHTADGPVEPDDPRRAAVMQQGWGRTFTRLASSSGDVRLIRDVPLADVAPGACLDRGDPDLGDCLFTPEPAHEAEADVSVRAAALDGVPVVDPRPWLCWRGRCAAVVGDVIPYIDRSHLTAVYAALLGESLGRRLGIWTA